MVNYNKEEIMYLPDEFKKIIETSDRTRNSAYYYRAKYAAFVAAAREVICKQIGAWELYDLIKEMADQSFKTIHTEDEKDELALHEQVKRHVVKVAEKMNNRTMKRISKHKPILEYGMMERGLKI